MGGLQKERITELSLEQIGICLMYILNKVIWRGGGREIKTIEKQREREREGGGKQRRRRWWRRRRRKKKNG